MKTAEAVQQLSAAVGNHIPPYGKRLHSQKAGCKIQPVLVEHSCHFGALVRLQDRCRLRIHSAFSSDSLRMTPMRSNRGPTRALTYDASPARGWVAPSPLYAKPNIAKTSDCSAGALPRRKIEPDITPRAQRATPLQLEDGSEIERPRCSPVTSHQSRLIRLLTLDGDCTVEPISCKTWPLACWCLTWYSNGQDCLASACNQCHKPFHHSTCQYLMWHDRSAICNASLPVHLLAYCCWDSVYMQVVHACQGHWTCWGGLACGEENSTHHIAADAISKGCIASIANANQGFVRSQRFGNIRDLSLDQI